MNLATGEVKFIVGFGIEGGQHAAGCVARGREAVMGACHEVAGEMAEDRVQDGGGDCGRNGHGASSGFWFAFCSNRQ